MAHLDQVLRVGGDAVLGPEEGGELHARAARASATEACARSRVIEEGLHDEADAQPAHGLGPVEQAFEPGDDAGHAVYSTNCSVNGTGGLAGALDRAGDGVVLERALEAVRGALQVGGEAARCRARSRSPAAAT